ncbi:helix-turn-helix protein [Hoeflea marina]|uniref:Helix-turn-helix protein n=2 Tax=Hoeflea marina TaxID=274592 RepID=A0A317PPQ5_9HYPH|nr:helix-turn-helix protein [Hoeflea marina]
MSQLALASEAEISQKHLSFIESGRARPSRDMVLHLAEHLDVPLRERNALLLGAGFAPAYVERDLDSPELAGARAAIGQVLKAHEPFPALTVDRHWTMLSANEAVAPLLAGIDTHLLVPPVNIMRLSLHPRGLAPLIVNLDEWRAHLMERLGRQFRLTRDPVIGALIGEMEQLAPRGWRGGPAGERAAPAIAVPLKLRTPLGVLSFISTTTVFGTASEITLSELSLEAFYPADAGTSDLMRRMAAARTP